MPNIIQSTNKQETISGLKKAYSSFSQITDRAIADNGPIESWTMEDSSNESNIYFHKSYILPYLNIIKDCGYSNDKGCNFKYKTFKGLKINLNNFYRFILNDGTLIASNIRVLDGQRYVRVYVDINGEKGPNILGKDVFVFIYYIYTVDNKNFKGLFLPECALLSRDRILNDSWGCNKKSETSDSGICCAELIRRDGWQIKEDYPW